MKSLFEKIDLDALVVDENGLYTVNDKDLLQEISGGKKKKGGGGGGEVNIVCHGCNLGCDA
ncbi:MAG: hypothetical protein CMF12_02090 [Idiomarina sp.]|uniref:hypothetical protein n=1 Tax=Idiomarina sp. TaxID=1874361 RepID=UPI000C56B5CF|nr:hypothetical protein [Idiomarina sp.]MBT41293.1 hypothetical protein [Idiomarina sp.]